MNRGTYALAVIFSLVFHGGLMVALTHGWEASEPERRPMPKFVQAKLVSAEALAPKKKTPPKQDLIKQRQQRELERQRREQAEKERRAAAERKKKAEAERNKKAAEEKARKERQRKEEERQEQLERERQSAFDEALEEEEELLEAREGDQAVMSVAQAIRQRIESAWSRPPSARNDMLTVVQINFVPTGRWWPPISYRAAATPPWTVRFYRPFTKWRFSLKWPSWPARSRRYSSAKYAQPC